MIIEEHIRPAYLATPNGRVHYLDAGSGKQAIVLFHETPLSAKSFLPTISFLAKHRRVIAFDTPGYGGSLPLRKMPSIEGYAENLWHAIQQLDLDEIAFCGIHTGTAIAVELAGRVRAGPKIVGAVLSGVTLIEGDARTWLNQLAERDTRNTGRGDICANELQDAILHAWQDRAQRWVNAPIELLVQALCDELAAFPRRDDGFKAVRDYDVRAAIERVKLPVLLLNGEKDSMAKLDEANVSLFHDARLTLLPNRGGQLQGSAPALYAEHVLDFLQPKFSR